jgi:hypothetical protein
MSLELTTAIAAGLLIACLILLAFRDGGSATISISIPG